MSYKRDEDQEYISYQALLDKNHVLENEIESLRKRLAEPEELKQVDEALLKSESRYRMLFTNMTEGFGLVEVVYNNDGRPYDYRYLEINPAFERYLGIKREQMLGRTMLELFPNVSSIAVEKYNEVARSGKPIHFEIFSLVANRNLDIYAFSPEKGKVALILRDITKRKLLEEQTNLRAEELETIMEVVPVPILINHDLQGRNITGNRMANEFYEAEAGENISASIPKGGRFFYKDRELTPSELPVQQAALKDEDLRNVELDVLLPRGRRRIITVSASPLHNTEGHVRGSVGAFIDITELKETEAKLKDTLNNLEETVKKRTAELENAYNSLKESEKSLSEAQRLAHIGSFDNNLVDNKLYWSDELYRIFGRNPHEGITYDKFLSYVHPEDRKYVYSSTEEAFKGKIYATNYRIVRPDGEERIVHSEREVVFDERNSPIRIRGTLQDITERKKAEEDLEKIEQIRIKEIHHRIKNNLQVISSLLDLQAEKFSHLKVCKVPEVLEAFVESQNRIVSMALIHEELYKGDNIDALDFAAYLNDLTTELFSSYNLSNNDNINLKLKLEQAYLNMDTAIPLGIIVNELVTNSFKHAFPAGREGEIQINLCRTKTSVKNNISGSDENCMKKNRFDYVLEVSDNGKGIPEEVDIKNTNSLGLQLVYILVEQIDGCIELKINNGTEFTLWFNNIEI